MMRLPALKGRILSKRRILEKYQKDFGECYIEYGHRKVGMNRAGQGDRQIYLIIPPKDSEDVKEFYLLNPDYTIRKKICGYKLAYSDNARDNRQAGWGTSHLGHGYCKYHEHKGEPERKARRKYLSGFLRTDRNETFINALEAVEKVPIEPMQELEWLIQNTKADLISKLQYRKEFIQVPNRDVDMILARLRNNLESQLNSLRAMRHEVFYSPVEIFRWLDEFKNALVEGKGKRAAEEILHILVNTSGLLNKTELVGEFNGEAIGGVEVGKLLEAFPLGYSDIENAEWEDLD